ncbi:MAG: hypothetical protein K6G48_05615 [Acholeplasmatales bacterium]|nr:hypothetical protein [Acholeplasmatales bacterium]
MDIFTEFLSNYGMYIAWVPTIIVGLCILVQLLLGLLRGLRKNTILMTLSIIALIVAYVVYAAVLTQAFFEEFVLGIYKSAAGESLQQTLNVSEENTRFKTIISAFVESKIEGDNANSYTYFATYVEALATSILGLIYMIFTIIIWQLLYRLFHLFIYLPFFREGKYKKKKIKEYEYQTAMNNIGAVKGEDNQEASKKEPKPYKRRRLLGGAVGILRGTLIGILLISIFGTTFYVVSGMDTQGVEEGESITVSFGDDTYDLTEVYNFMYDYDNTGVNYPLNNFTNSKGVPVYASISSLFCKGKIEVSDGDSVTVYPIEELGHIMSILHEGVRLLDSYGVSSFNKDSFNTLKTLVQTDEGFVDDVYDYITGIGATKLHRALGRTITNHFYDIVTNAGYDNKYLDVVFTGEHAINLDDLVSKDDIRVMINIVGDGLGAYDTYTEANKDVKELVINSVDTVFDVVDDLLELKIFNQDEENVNYVIGDLLELACDNASSLKDVEFDGVDFLGSDGEIHNFADALYKLLTSDVISYTDSNMYFNYKNINSIFNSDTEGETSVMDDIKSSEALRRISSCLIYNSDVDGNTLYVPESCKDSDGYITSKEFEGFFNAISDVVGSTTFSKDEVLLSDLASDIVPELISSISSNSELPGFVTQSNVLSAIAANYICQNLSSELTIPSYLTLDENTKEEHIESWLGSDGELYNLLNAVITFDLASAVTDGSDIDINSILDSEKIAVALNSAIVHYTISNKMVEEDATNTEYTIPSIAYDSDGVISKDEIINTIAAIEELESGMETKSIESIDQNVILNDDLDMDIILASNIIWYSISSRFGETTVEVPNASYVDLDADEKYVYKDEIKNTVEALKALGDTDLDNINVNSETFLSLYNDDTKLNTVLSSYIAWYKISKEFKEKITNIPADVIESISSQDYITSDEIKALSKAMNQFGETSISTYDVSESLLLNVSDLDVVLDSHIVWYEASIKIRDNGEFRILEDAMDYTIGDSVYMKYSEVYNMLYTCKTLGLTSLTSADISPVTLVEKNLTDYVSNTLTLRATICDSILYDHEKGIIYLNDDLVAGYDVYNSTASVYVYSADEAETIIIGLAKLGVDTYTEGLTFTMANVIALEQADRATVLESNTLWLYVSEMFKSVYTTYESYDIYSCTAGVVSKTSGYDVIAKSYIESYGL